MKFLDCICMALLIIGGLNWGLIAIANLDLVATLCGTETMLAKAIYGLVGLSAIYKIYCWCGCKKKDSCCR